MREKHFFTTKTTRIYPTPGKNANRILMIFERKYTVGKEDRLTIRNQGYTNEYYQLVRDYLTIT